MAFGGGTAPSLGGIYFIYMNTKTTYIVIGTIIFFAVITVAMKMYSDRRQGTEKLSAEQVVDLEVQADVQNGGGR